MPELEVLDPLDDIVEGEEPEGGEETPIADGAASGEEASSETEGDKTPITLASAFTADGRKLDPKVSAALTKLKEENPSLGKLVTKSLYRAAELEREFPGGLTEVRELRDKVEDLGGFTGIEEKLQGLAQYDGLSRQFLAGDPAFVDDLIESSKEAFASIAPTVFAKYAELNPEGWSAYVGKVMYGDMVSAEMPLMMMRLQDCIGALTGNEKALEAFTIINNYLGAFKVLAGKPMPESKAKPAQRTDGDLTKREDDLRAREWAVDRNSLQRQVISPAYKTALAGRIPTAQEKGEIEELFSLKWKRAADAKFPGWEKKSNAFISSKDKAGYLRYVGSIYKSVGVAAVTEAVERTLRGRATTKKTTPTEKVAPKVNGQQNGASNNGETYSPVAKEPDTWDIDWDRTHTGMLKQNRAYLKNGKRVTWKD